MTRLDETTRRVRVIEFRPPPARAPTSEPRVLVGPAMEPPDPDTPRRDDEITRPIRRG